MAKGVEPLVLLVNPKGEGGLATASFPRNMPDKHKCLKSRGLGAMVKTETPNRRTHPAN